MDTAKELLIIGAGGFGRVTAWIVERINEWGPFWKLLGFIDNEKEKGSLVNGYEVLGDEDVIAEHRAAHIVCAIGSAAARRTVVERVKAAYPEIKFAKLVDPTAEISSLVDIGAGTIICAHTIIEVNASLGEHVIVNMNCTVGHDAVLKDFVTLYPGVNVSGNTTIGSCAELGTGTQVIQKRSVAPGSIVGAGAVVIRDIAEPGTYVGVPAKRIK